MDEEKMSRVVKLALEDEEFRKKFLENPEVALSEKNLILSKEELERLLFLREEDYRNSIDGKTVMKGVRLVNKGSCGHPPGEVDVLCVCGTGWVAQ